MQTQHPRLAIATAVDNSAIRAGRSLAAARWLTLVGMAAFFGAVAAFLHPKGSTANTSQLVVAFAILGGYTLFTLLMALLLGVSTGGLGGFGRGSLFVDVLALTAACYFAALAFKEPLFAFAALPAVGIALLGGLFEAVLALIPGALATLAFLVVNTPLPTSPPLPTTLDLLVAPPAVISYSIIFAALLAALTALLIARTGHALIQPTQPLINTVMDQYRAAIAAEQQRRSDALFRIAKTLNESLNYTKITNAILGELETVFDVTVSALLTFDTSAAHDTLLVDKAVRLTAPEMETRIHLSVPTLRATALKAEPQLLTDLATDPDLLAALPSLRGCSAVMLAPLRGGFESYGVVLLGSAKTGAYTPADLTLFHAMAAQIGIAMQNAQLYHNLAEERKKILTAEEEVRRELNRNLHDGPAQSVAAFSMQTEYIRRLFPTDPDKALEELAALGKQAQQTSKEIRNLLFALRPLVLETQGLVGALEQFTVSLNQTPGNATVVSFGSEGVIRRYNPKVETAIFTILQEAVNNARKHAQAANIWLRLEQSNDMLLAIAQDDGVGFDLVAAQAKHAAGGNYGLGNMQERAALIGGNVRIDTTPGHGTRITLRIPISESLFQGAAENDDEPPRTARVIAGELAEYVAQTSPAADGGQPQPAPQRRIFGNRGRSNAGAVLGNSELPPPPLP